MQSQRKLRISDFKFNDNDLSDDMKNFYAELQKKFTCINEQFLDLFEQRFIYFIEDGTNVENFVPCKKDYFDNEKQMLQARININRFIVKYDFDIAIRLNPFSHTRLLQESTVKQKQIKFNELAFNEVL